MIVDAIPTALSAIAAHAALIQEAAADGAVVVMVASAICAMTKTPDPSTTRGKIYRALEAAALVIGKAKDKGLVPDNPVADKIGEQVIAAVKPILAPALMLMLAAAAISLQACAPDTATVATEAQAVAASAAPAVTNVLQSVQGKVASFEQTAAPAVADACSKFDQAEANPLVQLAEAGGTAVADAATGGIAGPVIAAVKSYGDSFCQSGPPVGDTTTPEQQAQWLNQQITAQLLSLVGAAPKS